MPLIVVGKCYQCDADVKADDRRDAATIPVMQRAAKLGKLTCKPCAQRGVTEVDRDNPPDVRT